MTKLRISEIFLSLQGETRTIGLPTIFVRLTGCPLRCSYCDTAYAFQGGIWMNIKDILAKIAEYGISYVTVTGGEPLAQSACLTLLTALSDQGYTVSLETSGAVDISQVDSRVSRVMDLKTPTSKESTKNLFSNLTELTPHDQLKFVICNRHDYEWAKIQLCQQPIAKNCEIIFSPVTNLLAPQDLANWILEDRLSVRFQLQLHKLLWGDQPGH